MPDSEKAIAVATLPLRDRVIIWGALGAITVLAWTYLARMPMAAGADMAGMGMAMAMPHEWTLADMWFAFVMWSVMMVAMMLPSAAAMIMMYARIARGRGQTPSSGLLLFALGYIVVWTAFSAGAAAAQYGLQCAALVSDALRVAPFAGGVILGVAGLYQLTPFKSACLGRCRSPLSFFMAEWRDGPRGALRMGLKHGAFCLGCCWMLMALLFVAGVMNLFWVAAISALILLEKLTPYGRAIAGTSGVALIASGIWLAALA